MPTSADVAVLGAGPAGLAAAVRLARRGRSVVVLDRATRVGGLAASHRVAEQRVDIGSHRLHPSIEPEILQLLRSLLGEDLQLRRRHGRIRLQGRWLAFPLSGRDLARALPLEFLLRAGSSAALAMLRPRRDATFADFVTTGLGTVMGKEFYFPYARKIWGVEPSTLSGAQARRRISADTPLRLLRRVIRPTHGTADAPPGTFFYPAGGFGRISEALADAATAAGAHLWLGRTVTGVAATATSAWVTTDDQAILETGTVLSTLPVTRLATMLGVPGADGPLAYRAMLVIYLVVEAPRYTGFDAHYFPGPDTPLTRISEPKNYREATAAWPDPLDITVLCAELPCAVGDARWTASDEDLAELVVATLRGNGLPEPRVREVSVLRQSHAYPIYPVDFEKWLNPMLAAIEARPRLISYGRQGLYAHDNTHHALAMAWAAAAAIGDDGAVDAAMWAAARRRFAEHVVED